MMLLGALAAASFAGNVMHARSYDWAGPSNGDNYDWAAGGNYDWAAPAPDFAASFEG